MTWQTTNRSIAGAAATITAPLSPDLSHQIRLRAIYCTLAGPAAGSATLVVRDGPTGTGSIIFQATLETAAASRDLLSRTDFDLRASVGNVLTVEFLAGTPNDFQSINAQGDFVPAGTPYGATPIDV